MRKVVIGTPIRDGEVLDFRYVDCLVRSVKELHDVELLPVWLTGDLANARNRIAKLAVEDIKGVDELVFIDADMTWAPMHLERLLGHDLDIVGGLYRKRTDPPVGVYGQIGSEKPDDVGLLKVDWCGTGFLRIRQAALVKLWARARPYTDDGTSLRAVFKNTYDGAMVSEDAFACGNWRALGGKIFVDTKICVGHVGTKVYTIGG